MWRESEKEMKKIGGLIFFLLQISIITMSSRMSTKRKYPRILLFPFCFFFASSLS